ncbi:LppU/SCO3897 family protein [Nocardia sp. IFM 10818]
MIHHPASTGTITVAAAVAATFCLFGSVTEAPPPPEVGNCVRTAADGIAVVDCRAITALYRVTARAEGYGIDSACQGVPGTVWEYSDASLGPGADTILCLARNPVVHI